MKATTVITFALVALGMTAQAAAVTESATTQGVDYRCYYNCMKQGRDDCDWLCNKPGPDRPWAAEGTLHKRSYQCYIGCISRCHDDSKCMDQCAWDCAGPIRPDPPMKKRDTAATKRIGGGCAPFQASCRASCRGNPECIDWCNSLPC